MSDPIKTALEAAYTVAYRRDAEDMDDDTVRRIIAAFLRALPIGGVNVTDNFGKRVVLTHRHLADIIERAVKEDSDE